MSTDNTWIVAVQYGVENNKVFNEFIASKQKKSGCKCICIRTDVFPGRILDNPNEAFEFSGYQEGLAIVLEEVNLDQGYMPNDILINIVFINDTVLTGHLSVLSNVLIDQLLTREFVANHSPSFLGLAMPANEPISSIAGQQEYISTWAFSLLGNKSILNKLQFYEVDEISASFAKIIVPRLPLVYLEYINNWLEPKNMFSGWYKAIPNIQLAANIKSRKMLTIYLEHTLPKRLVKLGFCSKDIILESTIINSLLLMILRKLDRLYVNCLKFKYRLCNLVARKISCLKI